MKYLFFLFIIIVGCNNIQQHPIEGVYTNKYESEYSVADDTIILKVSNPEMFSITRKTGFQRKRNNILLPKEYKTENLNGVYDATHHCIHEIQKGLTLICTGETIKINNTTYHKIQ